MNARRRAALMGTAVLVGTAALLLVPDGTSRPGVIVGRTDEVTSTAPAQPVVIEEHTAPLPEAEPEPEAAVAEVAPERRGPRVSVKAADGRPYGSAIPFDTGIEVPAGLQFVLVIGSDARPGQDMASSRADSLHLVAVDPATRRGTVVGFPRDSYVEIPGAGRGKINDALARGGPRLMAETVRRVSGLPVHYYVLTAFEGFSAMVDDLGGVDVLVERPMNDAASGARFAAGWHRFDGYQALAYARNRHDAPNGDFGRSHNHGNLMLAALGKMRSEVGDDAGLGGWLGVLRRHVALDVPLSTLPRLGALARALDPAGLTNVVLPGRIGQAGGASVVYLTEEASAMFVDLRDDAVLNASVKPSRSSPATSPGGGPPPQEGPSDTEPPPPPPSSTTTTTAPGIKLPF